jgi:hypothetical protein
MEDENKTSVLWQWLLDAWSAAEDLLFKAPVQRAVDDDDYDSDDDRKRARDSLTPLEENNNKRQRRASGDMSADERRHSTEAFTRTGTRIFRQHVEDDEIDSQKDDNDDREEVHATEFRKTESMIDGSDALPLSEVYATQQMVRSKETLKELIATFDVDTLRTQKLVVFRCLDDGRRYLHNGHHRALALLVAHPERPWLAPDEYVLISTTYERLAHVDRSKHWVTPFDPRSELRKADLAEFKRDALALADIDELCAYVNENRNRYVLKRPSHITTIHSLLPFADK